MKRKSSLIVVVMLYLCWVLLIGSAEALMGSRGDIVVIEAPLISEYARIMRTQIKVRAYNEALLMMGIPQHYFGDRIVDQQAVRGTFIHHTEILAEDQELENWEGREWRRYRFTAWGKDCLDPGYAGDIYQEIISHSSYKLPLYDVRKAYQKYCLGLEVPLVMMGVEFGQTVEEYTNFADFDSFMNKYHYCITATMWSIHKAIYDKCEYARPIFIERFSDPRTVQAHDTLTGGRLIGYLLSIGFIEAY